MESQNAAIAGHTLPSESPSDSRVDFHIAFGSPAFFKANVALFAAGFVTFALLYCVQPLLPLLSSDFHLRPVTASLAISVSTAALAVSLLLISTISDSFDRKKLMGYSLTIASVLAVISGLMPGFSGVLVLRALEGFALSGLPAVAMAYLSEEIEPKSLGTAMGLYVGGTAFGGMSGRLISGILSDFFAWRVSVVAIGTLGLAACALFWWLLPESKYFKRQPIRTISLFRLAADQIRDSALRPLFLIGMLLMGVFVTIYNYIGFRLLAPPVNLDQSVIAYLFIVYIVGVVSSTFAGRLANRIGKRRALMAMVALMLASIVLTLSGQLSLIILGVAGATFGFFGGHSVASSWVSQGARTSRALASALYLFSYYFGSSVLGSLNGIVWQTGRWPGVVAVLGALLIVALMILTRVESEAHASIADSI
jgi:YNFM family putative membrane transporter